MFVDGVSQKYEQQTDPKGSPPVEALAKERMRSPIAANGVSCSRHESGMLANSSRRSC